MAFTSFALIQPVASSAQVGDGPPTGDELPLWAVSHEANTVYLLGSIHMLRPDAYPLHEALYETFDASEVIVFELDYDEMIGAAPRMMTRGTFQDGRTLESVLPGELFSHLEGRLRALGIPIELIQPMKPWLAGLTLTSIVAQQAGYTAEFGIDNHFFGRAREAGKQVGAFETVDEQIDVFDGLSTEGQVSYLLTALDDMDRAASQLDELTDLWLRGNTERLAELLTESTSQHPELYDRLLLRRNRDWLPQLEVLLHSGRPAMVVVGLAHLVGQESVIELLRTEGYDVSRVGISIPR
jgi:uncharacterized protein